MAATREGRSKQVLMVVVLLLLINCMTTLTQALAVPDDNENGVPDMILQEFDEEEEFDDEEEEFDVEEPEYFDLGKDFDLRSDCNWTQFGEEHTVNLTPLDKCAKFKFIEGDIYQRGVSEEDKEAIITIHNKLRSKVAGGSEKKGNPGPQPSAANIRELVWNDQLAVAAQAWADVCAKGHDKANNRQTCDHKVTGQNVAHKRGKGKLSTTAHWTKFVQSLYKEVKNMPNTAVDQLQKPPKGNTAHYTQVIWAKSHQVGCGIVYYDLYEKKNNGKLRKHLARSFVCNYWPSGNYKGAQVYETGPPASNCDNGVSNNYKKLCAPPSE